MARLRQFAEFFQGEVNETNEKAKGTLVPSAKAGHLVTRGACICQYVVRPASQGEDLYLDVRKFLASKGRDTKAYHHQYRRTGLQESCPQNNFRRIIASLVPAGSFCNHKVNYLPEHKSRYPLEVILGLLNSKLADWYFRLGSTNAAVSHYQVYNLPCPAFREEPEEPDAKVYSEAMKAMARLDIGGAIAALKPRMAEPPYGTAVRELVVEAVKRIIAIEEDRGEIARSERSSLAPEAQPYQDLLDHLFYEMAGLAEAEWRAMESRLSQML
jgi:hypothetical protein